MRHMLQYNAVHAQHLQTGSHKPTTHINKVQGNSVVQDFAPTCTLLFPLALNPVLQMATVHVCSIAGQHNVRTNPLISSS